MAVEAATQGGVVIAKLDSLDHIRFADDEILRLQEAAGGAPDGRIAVPQIAAVARLARRLRILIARPLLIGGQSRDIRLWVRAQPINDGVELRFSDWQEAVHQDERKNAASRLADIALAPDGVDWRIDAQMRFIQLDPGLEAFSSGDELFSCLADIPEDGWPLASSIANRQAFFGILARSRVTGQFYRFSGHPLFDADGSFLGYRGKAGVVEQPTEEPAQQADPAEAEPQVAANENGGMIPDFGRRLDLALRQPLTRIIANAETISKQIEGPLRGDYSAYAADIADAGRHLMELVDDLADLQAIDRPNFTVASEAIDLADLARRAAGLLAVKSADRDIRVVPPAIGEIAPAIGEFRRALQIIVNLLNNAIRYSPEGSTIWLRTDVEGDQAMLVVADQGRGIALEDQERVFEKFERLGRDDAQGSGLGLYISRRLARAMRGDLTIESAPGQGARFILTLPKE